MPAKKTAAKKKKAPVAKSPETVAIHARATPGSDLFDVKLHRSDGVVEQRRNLELDDLLGIMSDRWSGDRA